MRHKTHMVGTDMAPLCRQKPRTLLPPAVVGSWDAVTCERCLGHRPTAPVGWVTRWLRAFMARVRG